MGFGGSEARVLNLLELLQDDYDVTLITTNYVDLKVWNSFYRTSVNPRRIQQQYVPMPSGMQNNLKWAGIRGAFYQRFCRQIGKEYDLCISAYNLTDWGNVKQLHFIADFCWDRNLTAQFFHFAANVEKKRYLFRKGYKLLCRIIAGKHRTFSEMLNHDVVIANSLWSNNIIQCNYHVSCNKVIYPPVNAEFMGSKRLEDRSLDFVSIGRIAPEKQIEQQIDIISKVREKNFDIKLHLIGAIGNDAYGQQIQQLIAGKKWVIVEGRQSGDRKAELLTSNRFALHTCPHEAFGITVAEFLQAGCIPFIPASGGQTEIIPFHDLQFDSTETAVERIITLLKDPDRQQTLYRKLQLRKNMFSRKKFQEKALDTIKDFQNKI